MLPSLQASGHLKACKLSCCPNQTNDQSAKKSTLFINSSSKPGAVGSRSGGAIRWQLRLSPSHLLPRSRTSLSSKKGLPNCLDQSPRPSADPNSAGNIVLHDRNTKGIHQYVFHSGRPSPGLAICSQTIRGIRSTLAHDAHFNLVEHTDPSVGPSLHSLVLSVRWRSDLFTWFQYRYTNGKSSSLKRRPRHKSKILLGHSEQPSARLGARQRRRITLPSCQTHHRRRHRYGPESGYHLRRRP